MNKDPAFLFYSSDFLTGCLELNMEERGQYITLMCMQHQLGHLSERTIGLSLGSVSQYVLNKFYKDENGNYFNERLEEEIRKRSKHVEKQRENGKKGGRPKKPKETQKESQKKPKQKPLENENENEIENIIEYLNKKTNRKYNPLAKKNRKVILERFNEGYLTKDFYTAIDSKCKDWLENEKMNEFLRPETLFSEKFDGYLNKKNLSGNPEWFEKQVEKEKLNSKEENELDGLLSQFK